MRGVWEERAGRYNFLIKKNIFLLQQSFHSAPQGVNYTLYAAAAPRDRDLVYIPCIGNQSIILFI